MLSLWLACAPPSAPVAPTAPPPSYEDQLTRIDAEAARIRAAPGDRATRRTVARRFVLDTLTAELFPAWQGTPWAFSGTTEVPGEGQIACGYFVSTLLRDAGFDVERVALAQQPSEWIARTFVPATHLSRFRRRPVDEAVDHVVAEGEGLYVVGLDYHVGLLWNDGHTVQMCHSSPYGGAACEDARAAPAMVSNLHVVGKLLDDAMIDGWLADRPFPTYAGTPLATRSRTP